MACVCVEVSVGGADVCRARSYQSGCLLASDGSRALRWEPVAFEIIQAMVTSMAF
eukprot:COSAG01_NODE_37205_length_507_cov_0.549020_2_plen_54_part_01